MFHQKQVQSSEIFYDNDSKKGGQSFVVIDGMF